VKVGNVLSRKGNARLSREKGARGVGRGWLRKKPAGGDKLRYEELGILEGEKGRGGKRVRRVTLGDIRRQGRRNLFRKDGKLGRDETELTK